ncbi:MAG: hypothetical protein R3D57_08900 [Hyphomicrobiaceae bacterium]
MHRALMSAVLATLMLAGGVTAASSEQDKNFVVTIDGREVGIDLGESLEVETSSGQKVQLSLRRAEKVTFRGALMSFVHRGDMAVSSTTLDKDITQHLLASANGTVIIVQEYEGLDPTTLLELMLTSVTEESIAAGAKMTKAETTRDAGGQAIKGLKAEVVNGSDKTEVEAYTIGKDGKGVVIVTQMADDYHDIDQALLDEFWKSLALKL